MRMISRDNNFDLVRLFAAFQVVFFHIQDRLGIVIPNMNWFRCLKGVPIFFTVSGFLITASYLNNRNLRRYFTNRFLRIYPAIYMLIAVTTLAALYCGDMSLGSVFKKQYLHWIISWVTIDHNYSPPFLAEFGIGTPNGSLWTIPVEITFYLLVPVLFSSCFVKRHIVLYSILFSLGMASVVSNYLWHDFYSIQPIIWKFTFSLAPYLYYFLFGATIYLFWDRIKPYLENKFLLWFFLLIGLILLNEAFPSLGTKTSMTIHTLRELLMNVLLSVTAISAAFSYRGAAKFLKGNDLSYGIYLYHGLVINVVIECTDTRNSWIYLLVYFVSICCAWLSWHYVEKPCLDLKKRIHINHPPCTP